MKHEEVIRNLLMSEKSMDKTDRENKLTFLVHKKANKNQIREAVEKLYEVKVVSVNTQFTMKGQKRAYVRLAPENNASEIATAAGVL